MYSLLIVLIFGGLVAAIAIVIGVLAFYKAWHEKRKTQTTRRWFTLNGTILESEVEELPGGAGDGPRQYRVRLRYSYQVGDLDYQGTHQMIGDDPFGSKSSMEKIAATYPVGKQVEVHYNPSNPAEAVLEKQSESSNKAIFVGIAFILIALCIGCYALSYFLYRN
jgi:hypothetical protein